MATRQSADASERAADGQRMAAEAIRRATEVAGEALLLERRRRHDDRFPLPPGAIDAVRARHAQLEGVFSLRGSVTVPRDYRVRVDAITSN